MLTNANTADSVHEGFIRAAEAARLLGMSEAALRIAEQRGDVPAYRLGSRVLFDKAELVALVKASRSA